MILVASDLHGSKFYTELLINKANELRPELTILLGDLYYHGPRNGLSEEYDPQAVANMLNDYNLTHEMIVIKGNCDAEVDEMISNFKFIEEDEIEKYNTTFLLTHGHKKNITNLSNVNSDVLLYGHTHVPMIENADGIMCANPGSVSLPKEGSTNSFMIIDNEKISIYDLITNEIIMEQKYK